LGKDVVEGYREGKMQAMDGQRIFQGGSFRGRGPACLLCRIFSWREPLIFIAGEPDVFVPVSWKKARKMP
jgi:hypothetical protein